jgi:hypothetical protein
MCFEEGLIQDNHLSFDQSVIDIKTAGSAA